jgi:hypothetical protein
MTDAAEINARFFDRFSDPKVFGLVALGLFAAGIAIGFKLAGGMPVELEPRQVIEVAESVEPATEVPYVEPLDYVESPIEE